MKRSNLVAVTTILLFTAFVICVLSSCKKETVEPETPTVPVVDLTQFAKYQGQYRIIYDSRINQTTSCCWNYKIIIKDNYYQGWRINLNTTTELYYSTEIIIRDNKFWINNTNYIYKCEGNQLMIMDATTGWYKTYEKY